METIRRCCIKHEEEDLKQRHKGQFAWAFHRLLIVCGTCGNKRCPKATDCALECTGSNASGQDGSIFGEVRE